MCFDAVSFVPAAESGISERSARPETNNETHKFERVTLAAFSVGRFSTRGR